MANVLAFTCERQSERSERRRSSGATPCWAASSVDRSVHEVGIPQPFRAKQGFTKFSNSGQLLFEPLLKLVEVSRTLLVAVRERVTKPPESEGCALHGFEQGLETGWTRRVHDVWDVARHLARPKVCRWARVHRQATGPPSDTVSFEMAPVVQHVPKLCAGCGGYRRIGRVELVLGCNDNWRATMNCDAGFVAEQEAWSLDLKIERDGTRRISPERSESKERRVDRERSLCTIDHANEERNGQRMKRGDNVFGVELHRICVRFDLERERACL